MKDNVYYHNVYDILFEPILYKNNLCLITELPIHINQIKKPFYVYSIHYVDHYGSFEMITNNCATNRVASLITSQKINLIENLYLEINDTDIKRLYKPKLSLFEYSNLLKSKEVN